MTAQSPPIAYGPPLPLHRRRRARRATLLIVVGAMLASSWWWGRPAWHRVQALGVQRQCMTFAPPPGQLVYQSDLAADPFARTAANAVVQPAPAFWTAFQRTVPPPAALPPGGTPSEDSAFAPLAPAPAYSHARDAGRGRRLVVAQLGAQLLGGKVHRVICCRVFAPATWRRDPLLLWEGNTIVAGSFEWTATLRAFAGQTDRHDPAHFTIAVEVDGVTKTLDARLQPDDTVKTAPRDASGAN